MENDGKYKVIKGMETVEVHSYTACNKKGGTVKRIDKDTYEVVSTGQVRKYKTERTEGNYNAAMNRKLAALRNVIRANARSKIDMFATLTYDKTTSDYKVVQDDVERCMRRLRRKYNIKYIAVPELQTCGRWHVHVIIIVGDDGESFISHDELAKAWERGGVHISSIRNANAVALYLSNNGERKRAMRLKYPRNMRLYRCSKDIKRPEPIIMYGEDAAKQVAGYTLIHQRTYCSADGYWHSASVYGKNGGN